MILVARHDLTQILFGINPPHRVIKVVSHRTVRRRTGGCRTLNTAVLAFGPHVRVLPNHPDRAGHVRSQRGVDPELQAMTRSDVHQLIQIAEVETVRFRPRPVPGVEGAGNRHARRGNGGQVTVPELRPRRRRTVVFDAGQERTLRIRRQVLVMTSFHSATPISCCLQSSIVDPLPYLHMQYKKLSSDISVGFLICSDKIRT